MSSSNTAGQVIRCKGTKHNTITLHSFGFSSYILCYGFWVLVRWLFDGFLSTSSSFFFSFFCHCLILYLFWWFQFSTRSLVLLSLNIYIYNFGRGWTICAPKVLINAKRWFSFDCLIQIELLWLVCFTHYNEEIHLP